MTNCTCIDCMYGGNVGNEHGGIAPPSKEKGDGEMGEVNPAQFRSGPIGVRLSAFNECDNHTGLSYLNDQPSDRIKFDPGVGWIGAPTHYTAYVVKAGTKERYAKTKEKALQFASEMLDCDGKVEIKRIELS